MQDVRLCFLVQEASAPEYSALRRSLGQEASGHFGLGQDPSLKFLSQEPSLTVCTCWVRNPAQYQDLGQEPSTI